MNNKDRKKLQNKYAKNNLNKFFTLIETRFYPKMDSNYINEIKKISTSFNIRLTREQKLKFCKKCNTYLNINTKIIRINPKTCSIEHICKNCGHIKRFKFSKNK
jgi:RNase P subunit RPR2